MSIRTILIAAVMTPAVLAQQFEVASVKACKDGAGPGGGASSPVSFNLPCMPVRFFINLAYLISNARPDASTPTALEGGPAWIDSDRYQIHARAGEAASKAAMNGPML